MILIENQAVVQRLLDFDFVVEQIAVAQVVGLAVFGMAEVPGIEVFDGITSGQETGGGFETSPDYLFDLADEVQGTAWGYDPDGVLDGWLRTVDWDRSDAGRSEILIVLNAFKETNGYSLLYIKEPLDVDPSVGAQNKEIRPLVKELVDITGSSDPHRYSVIAAGFPAE